MIFSNRTPLALAWLVSSETQGLRFSEQQNNDSGSGTEMQRQLQHRRGSNAGKDSQDIFKEAMVSSRTPRNAQNGNDQFESWSTASLLSLLRSWRFRHIQTGQCHLCWMESLRPSTPCKPLHLCGSVVHKAFLDLLGPCTASRRSESLSRRHACRGCQICKSVALKGKKGLKHSPKLCDMSEHVWL